MKIRRFRPADAKDCLRLMKKNKRFLGDIYTLETLVETAKQGSFWVAEEGSRLVGLAGFVDLHNGIGMGVSICVDPKIQGRGVGTKLVRKIKSFAQKEKYRKVLFLINAGNKRMMSLAIKEDFVPEGSLQKHFRTGEDVVYFSFFLNPGK